MKRKILSGFIILAFLLPLILFVLNSQPTSNLASQKHFDIDSLSNKMSIKVLTFNAGLFELYVFGIPFIKPADFLEQRLESMPIEILKVNADVIGLQEVYTKRHQDYLVENLKGTYPYHYYQRNRAVKANNGLMYFSKYPIIYKGYYPLKNRGPLDERVVVQKGILTCIIDFGEVGKVQFINIHPTAGGFLYQQDSPEIIKIRSSQITQAFEFSEKNTSLPSIILGDFNAGPEIAVENYQLLIEKGFADAYHAFCQAKNLDALITWDSENLLNQRGTHPDAISQRIDHIYISPSLQKNFSIYDAKRVFDETIVKTNGDLVTISDHYGVVVQLLKD